MKILVVDDEALLVKGIRFNLQNEGYDVITGSDGLDAVRLVQELNPDPAGAFLQRACGGAYPKEENAGGASF